MLIALAILILAIAVGLFYGSAKFMAYVDIKSRPREEMMWCHKAGHGHYRKGYAIPMNGVLVCPQCYAEALAGPDGKVKLRR